LNIVIQNLSGSPISLHDYSQKAITQMKVVFKDGMEVVESGPTTVNGTAAYKFVFKGKNTDIPLQFQSVWFIESYKAYQLTYTSFASKFDIFLPKINSMVNSFRLQ